MRFVVPVILLLVAAIHALPLMGVLGADQLQSLYGVAVADPDLEILMRHRAVLFGLLAAFLVACAIRPQWQGLGIGVALVSVSSFAAIAHFVGGYNTHVARVVNIDLLAAALLWIGLAVLLVLRRRGQRD
jgi:hypothetical protein